MKSEIVLKNFQEAIKTIPAADILSFVNNLTDAYREHQKTNIDIATIDAKKEFLIAEMREKYSFYRDVFGKIFDQRSLAIDKFFEVIDKGLKENNNDLVSSGLKSLSDVVSKSPFGDLKELKSLMESNQVIEI